MYSVESIREKLMPIFDRYNVKQAILFGSYAKGMACDRSDVDIYVDSGLKGLSFFGLLEDVSNALDIPVDLIDASQVDPKSGILSEINSSGVLIY